MATLIHELLRSEGYDRVRAHSAPIVNDRIDRITDAAIRRASTGPDARARRLVELDAEWDIDRALMVNFAVVGGTAFLLGQRVDRRWLYLFGAQLGFLFLHAAVGWCPPASLFRRLGFRTRQEIDAERAALRELARVT